MWVFFIALYFVFGAASYLLRKSLAVRLPENSRAINAIFFALFLMPAGLILSLFFPHNLNVGAINVALLLGGSVIWPLFYIVAYKANEKTDAGIFAIIGNLSPVATLAIAIPFLGDELSLYQMIGIALLISSGVFAALPSIRSSKLSNAQGILLCFLSAAILGTAVAYEKFMLDRVDFGAYLIYGWGSQILWSILLAGRELKRIPGLLTQSSEIRNMIVAWGTSSALRSVCFVIALSMASASLVSAASDFLAVVVVGAAYLFLREKENMVLKLVAALVGTSGLLLVAT